jgi:hypothetical protein
MADAVIGALRVVLGADTAQFDKGLSDAQKSLSSFGKNIATIASGIGLERIIEKSVSTAVGAVADGFDRIDKLGKEAQKAGIGVDVLSGLQLSAELADVSLETLSRSLSKLNTNMVDASKGTGTAKDTFDALGVSVKNADGSIKSADQVLGSIADKFNATTDSATKTAAATALFGRAGRELIPLLNDGAKGLEEVRKTAEAMGLVIDQNTAASVQKFNDNLKILAKTKEGIVNLVIAGVIPALVRLSDQFIENAKDGAAITQTANFIVKEFQGLVSAVFETVAAFNALIDILGLIQTLWEVRNTELFNKALEDLQNRVKQFPADLEGARKAAQDLFAALDVGGRNATGTVEPGISKLSNTIASFTLRTAELRGEFNQLAVGFAAQAASLDLTDKAAQGLSRTQEGLTAAQAQLNQVMLQFEGARLANEAKPAWEKYNETLAKTQVLLDANAISAAEAGRINQKAGEVTGQAWDLASGRAIKGWVDGLSTLAKSNKDLAGVAKGVAIAQAIINTYTAATKSYAELGWPFGIAAAAGAVLAGFALVRQIEAQQFARGGSFRVGGGLTGMDSEMVAFRATPGEMVDIRRPGQTGGTGGVQTLVLDMPNPNEFFAVHVREMVNTLNRAAPDGYTLKVAK